MANANASSPGRNIDTAGSILEQNIPKGTEIGINEHGQTVKRTIMSNGNFRDSAVFAEDHPDAKPFVTAEAKAELKAEAEAELRAEIEAEIRAKIKAETSVPTAELKPAPVKRSSKAKTPAKEK